MRGSSGQMHEFSALEDVPGRGSGTGSDDLPTSAGWEGDRSSPKGKGWDSAKGGGWGDAGAPAHVEGKGSGKDSTEGQGKGAIGGEGPGEGTGLDAFRAALRARMSSAKPKGVPDGPSSEGLAQGKDHSASWETAPQSKGQGQGWETGQQGKGQDPVWDTSDARGWGAGDGSFSVASSGEAGMLGGSQGAAAFPSGTPNPWLPQGQAKGTGKDMDASSCGGAEGFPMTTSFSGGTPAAPGKGPSWPNQLEEMGAQAKGNGKSSGGAWDGFGAPPLGQPANAWGPPATGAPDAVWGSAMPNAPGGSWDGRGATDAAWGSAPLQGAPDSAWSASPGPGSPDGGQLIPGWGGAAGQGISDGSWGSGLLGPFQGGPGPSGFV